MSKEEQIILASKLQSELAEFREREMMYIDKRKELQDLELKYRKKQDLVVGIQGKYRAKRRTNDIIVNQLLEQIDQNRRILESQQTENEELQTKISTQRQTCTMRESEIGDMKDRITFRATKSEDLRSDLDKIALKQKLLI